jgi:hypothetical protein
MIPEGVVDCQADRVSEEGQRRRCGLAACSPTEPARPLLDATSVAEGDAPPVAALAGARRRLVC